MARPVTLTQTGVGSSNWYPTDVHRTPFQLYFSTVVTGDVLYAIEHTTFPDIYTVSPVPDDAIFVHPEISGMTMNQGGAYNDPVMGVRVRVMQGDGTVEATFIQAGIRGG